MSHPAKLTFACRPWDIPSEKTALGGWVEGRVSEQQRKSLLAIARRRRAAWQPDSRAWDQLVELQRFVDKQVRIQFWDHGSMWLLNEGEWPHAVLGECQGTITIADEGRLQAYLLLRRPVNARTGRPSDSIYLTGNAAINCTLAPLAHLYEIESMPGTA